MSRNKKLCFDGNVRARKISEMLVFEIRVGKVDPTAISIPFERDAEKRWISVTNVRFASVRAEFSSRHFCCGQL